MHTKFCQLNFFIYITEGLYCIVQFIDNVIIQVDILLVGVGIEICGINIYQFLNDVENSIDWCLHIKSHMFDQILTLGNHLMCDFSISVDDTKV